MQIKKYFVALFLAFCVVSIAHAEDGFKVCLTNNPFSPNGAGENYTVFVYNLPNNGTVTIRVYDTAGNLIRTLIENEYQSGGHHEIAWRGGDDFGHCLPSGIYIYRVFVNFADGTNKTIVGLVGVVRRR